mmetsp:Transcript_61110/g.169438  ORF Transcript_61110/g.169438 Transcript_61110/m.169438 type:complete len:182 (+) Transcript_61110:363-908(+)
MHEFDHAEIEVDVKKLMILMPLWVSFLIGSYFGAGLHKTLGLQERAFLVPASITGCMGIAYTCFGQILKRKFKEIEQSRLKEEVVEVETMLRRVNQHLTLLHQARAQTPALEDEADGEPVDATMVQELEQDIEDLIVVIHDVEETLQDGTPSAPTSSGRGPSRRPSTLSRLSGTTQNHAHV